MARNKLTAVGLTLWVLGAALACTQLLGEVCIDDAEHDCAGADTVIGNAKPEDAGDPGPIMSGPAGDPCVVADVLDCKGPEFQKCVQGQSGLSWLTLDVCDSAALCSSVGVAGCMPPVCREGEMTCTGASLQMCNAELTGFTEFALCETAGHCDATGRACRAVPCEPGMLRCNGPELQTCRQDQLDWDPVPGGTCATPELCEAGRTRDPALGPLPGGAVCPAPECEAGALRCTGAALERCSNGRTGWDAVETCGTPALCELGRASAGSVPGAAPACAPQVCSPGGFQCTPAGALEQCNADLTAYTLLQQCDGPPFCNASLGVCTNAPCEAGHEQCSGAQILQCTADRTDLVRRELCDTPALCNATNPLDAICIPPTCAPGTPNEFICQGATLLRCNAGHTGHEFFAGCASPALCNPSRRTEGCVPPACQPNQHSCSTAGLLSVCRADLTGFQPQENCGQGKCDATLGRCADPCAVGAARCNPQGNLEECRDPLVGWQVTAACNSVARCDSQQRRCKDCDPTNPLFCDGNTLRRCNPSGFGSTIAAGTADACSSPNAQRTCANGALQTPSCLNANSCDGSETCVNGACRGGTAVVCPDDNNVCNGNLGCNTTTGACTVAGTNAARGTQCSGGVCNGTGACVGCNAGDPCGDGNACTNDSCNTTNSTCSHVPKCTGVNDVCIGAAGTCVECAQDTDCPATASTCLRNVCVACIANQCNAMGQLVACVNGRLQPPASCGDAFACTTDSCLTSACVNTQSNALCADANPCNGNETCVGANGDARGCQGGIPLAVGASCGTGQVCSGAGACIRPACTSNAQCAAATECKAAQTCSTTSTFVCEGGGAIREGLACTPGAAGTLGVCRSGTCTPAGCITAANCNPGNACNLPQTCSANNVCVGGGPVLENTSCGVNQVCRSGACTPVECDADNDCDPANACRTAEACVGNRCTGGVEVEGRCVPATGALGLCQAGICIAVQCIDGSECLPNVQVCNAAHECVPAPLTVPILGAR